MELAPGQQIGTYRIIRLLGQGGMGAVYEVEHTQLGVHYALKAFTLESGHVDVLKNKFLTESKVLARLHDPHLVHVFDLNFDEATGMPYEAAVEHVLTKVAMKQQSREIYRAYVLEDRPIDEVSATFGVTPDIIYKVKNRVNKMIEAVEMEYAE